MRRSRFGLVGLFFLVPLGFVIAFVATKHRWYDTLTPDDMVLFWTNLTVGLGTLLLAGVTVRSVLETRAVVRAEDRRMQQGFAPYLTASFRRGEGAESSCIIGFAIKNEGYGLARNIQVEATYYSYESEGDPEETTIDRVAEAKTYGKGPYTLAAACEVVPEKGERVAYIDYSPYYPDAMVRDSEAVVEKATLRYQDMFDNHYETVYTDWYQRDSKWLPPASLRIS